MSLIDHRGTLSVRVPSRPLSIQTRSLVIRYRALETPAADVAAFLLSPNHSVFGSLAHCSVRLAFCSASFCLPWSAMALPWSATCLRRSFQLTFPAGAAAGASTAGGGEGGGGGMVAVGGGSSVVTGSWPVVPWSDTCSVQVLP